MYLNKKISYVSRKARRSDVETMLYPSLSPLELNDIWVTTHVNTFKLSNVDCGYNNTRSNNDDRSNQ